MILLFITGSIISLFFTIYNLVCYKRKTTVYMLNSKYTVLDNKYFITQLIFGLTNSSSLLIFYVIWFITIKNPSTFLFGTFLIFWGLNYILTYYSRKKGYINIAN